MTDEDDLSGLRTHSYLREGPSWKRLGPFLLQMWPPWKQTPDAAVSFKEGMAAFLCLKTDWVWRIVLFEETGRVPEGWGRKRVQQL